MIIACPRTRGGLRAGFRSSRGTTGLPVWVNLANVLYVESVKLVD